MGIVEILATAGQWLPLVVTVASAITAATPNKRDDRALRRVLRVLHVVGLNVGHARPVEGEPERRRGVSR
ncbi:MAG: hypothetical protein LC725_08065 [Lentisphaerae bacterium]|nr:hypothetical protein [Lentisphaerota bacterium]